MADFIERADHYIVLITKEHIVYFQPFRQIESLEVCVYNEQMYAIAGWKEDLMQHADFQSIPFKTVYKIIDDYLYHLEGQVPFDIWLSDLYEWKPLTAYIQIELPPINYNFFGINESIDVRLIPSSIPQTPVALRTSLEHLEQYLNENLAIRSAHLNWILLNTAAFVYGTPLLSMPGLAYWQLGQHLLPIGWQFEIQNMIPFITQRIQPNSNELLLWETNGTYTRLSIDNFTSLTLGSVRKTIAGQLH